MGEAWANQKRNRLQILGKWRRMANDVLKLQKNRRLFVVGRFARLIRRYVLYRGKLRTMQAHCRLRMLCTRYNLLKRNQRRVQVNGMWRKLARKSLEADRKKRSLQVYAKWFHLADRYLSYFDEEYRQKRVNEKWRRMIMKLKESSPAFFQMSHIQNTKELKKAI